jgi:N-acylneuraminate cytidylyltransferase/CMP-N,N'-diacetyllegionaminic acid synthase
MDVLFLITARGGSKSIPGKNLCQIGGLSLVGYKARSARRSKYCSRLIISTDSPEIQAEARRHGAEVPFTRPAELASDAASSMDVIAHAVTWIEQHEQRAYDAIMLLEPSSPFARARDYDQAVELMLAKNAQVVLGMREMEVHSTFVGAMDAEGRLPDIVEKILQHRSRRRQDMPPEYTMNGALYLCRWEFFKQYRDFYADPGGTYGLVMCPNHSVEIDEPASLSWAQFLVASKTVDMSEWL